MPRAMLIDTDTASDDAVALIMAARWADVQIEAVTIVAGNVPVDQGVRNALYTLELCGSDAPVHRGSAEPLRRSLVTAQFFHGGDGLGDRGYPPPRRGAAAEGAVEAIVRTARENPGLLLVTLGPLTNLARALEIAPDLASLVGRCVVMGGAACTVGNVTPAAEFNLWVDPDAARIVFESGLPIEMVGWELCRQEANLDDADMAHVRSFDNPLALFAIDCNAVALEANRRQSGDPGLGLPDPIAMAIALDPSVCTRRSAHRVLLETESELTRGMTVVDALEIHDYPHNEKVWGHLARPNVVVCWEIDVPAWKAMLFRSLRDG
ncbi:MAG: nucleoside hydrolase [Gemmatimonadales bacterium]